MTRPENLDRPRFGSFREFYPFYLAEHANRTNRRLHFTGTLLLLVTALVAALLERPALLWLLPVIGYGFAWLGHYAFEKNRPATFRHPFYSLAGDFVMFRDMLTGRIPF
ncbi:MAG: Mpo1-like protein [Gammaproteobacteria bacterium]